MKGNSTLRSGPADSGRLVHTRSRDVRARSAELVENFLENDFLYRRLSRHNMVADLNSVVRTCLELSLSLLNGKETPQSGEELAAAAVAWARDGVPIDTVLQVIHDAVTVGIELAADEAADRMELVEGARLGVVMLNTITATIALAYVSEVSRSDRDDAAAVRSLTSSLLEGRPVSILARECGVDIADRYSVLAVAIPAPRTKAARVSEVERLGMDWRRRKLEEALASRCGKQALSLLSSSGGTLLIPTSILVEADVEELLAQLSRETGISLTAAVVGTARGEIPSAAAHAHELLDIVQRLDYLPGLYRFQDLAIEFQLARPGPARAGLGSRLDPLDEHPELMSTLRAHISTGFHRQETARLLHIHINTLDYRLKKIGQLTGFDPISSVGLAHLRLALIARVYETTDQRRTNPPRKLQPPER